jgi:hypothetical protein
VVIDVLWTASQTTIDSSVERLSNHSGRRCSYKALIANYAGFGGLFIFHYFYKRNQTLIRETRKFYLSTPLVKD